MKLKSYKETQRIIKENDHNLQIDMDPAPESFIKETEKILDLKFSDDYIDFLKDYGFLGYGSLELYGVTNGDPYVKSVFNTVWMTLDERKNYNLPQQFVIVAESGMGELYVLDTKTNRVELVELGDDDEFNIVPDEPEESYENFSAFFCKMVQQEEKSEENNE